jgi:hypothetical protein
MGVAMENHIDILRRDIRRNVNQTKPHPVSLQVDREWPIEIAIAIAAYDCDRRPESLDRLENGRGAHIAEMPDFVRISRQRFDVRRQFVVRIGENEDSEQRRHC